jgi:hypothetical protein
VVLHLLVHLFRLVITFDAILRVFILLILLVTLRLLIRRINLALKSTSFSLLLILLDQLEILFGKL